MLSYRQNLGLGGAFLLFFEINFIFGENGKMEMTLRPNLLKT
jgi:hypothetical protein